MRRLLHAALLLLLCSGGVAAEPWRDYQIIEWQHRNEAQLATLKRIGVTAAAVIADRGDGMGIPLPQQTAPLQQAGLRWYVENIATDFYSAYHRWTPGKPVNWRFLELQRRYRADPSDNAALVRDPSLVDPVWQARIDARLATIVRQESRFHPLYYNLGDETGIADLSAFWDFDLSPMSVAGMRAWLRGQYRSLAALNAEWGTHYASWHVVQPETTRQAMQRTDGNFAAWADFKMWMDMSFTRALRNGTDAVHTADPRALAGIEGAQITGWGGYDYTRLTHAVDLMEVDEDPRILHALNPRLVTLITSFGGRPEDQWKVWRSFLRGTRGLVLWDSDNDIVHTDGTLDTRGEAYATMFAELHRLALTLSDSQLHTDPVAILYSPASFRTQWMLDQQPKGDAWIERGADTELEDNAWRVALRGFVGAVARLGLQPHFVSAAMLPGLRDKLLILPDALALSADDARAIAAFTARGGTVVADRPPGSYDAHSRRLSRTAAIGTLHIVAPDDEVTLAALLKQTGVLPAVQLRAPRDDVELYVYRHGDETIIALQRMQPGGGPEDVALTLPRAMTVTDLRNGKSLGRTQQVSVTLDPIAPTVLLGK